MPNLLLRFAIGTAVALSCVAPAMAQQAKDPLTRFLDGVFKPQTDSVQTAPAPQPEASAPAPAEPRKTKPKKTAASKPKRAPQATVQAQPAAEPKPESAPEPPVVRHAEPEPQPVEKAASEPTPPEAKPAEPAPATPAPVQVAAPAQAEEPAVAAAEPPQLVAPPPETPKTVAAAPHHQAPAPTPVAAKAPAAPALPSSPAAALERVNAYFNTMDQMTANFLQKNPNGQQVEGTLAVKRPGILQFAYAPPSTLEIVSDGRNVAIRDKRLGTNDVYPIGQTPLKFLLQEHVDLARDSKIKDVQVTREGMVTVSFDDSTTLGGTSRIILG